MKKLTKLLLVLSMFTSLCLFAGTTTSPKILQVKSDINPNNALIVDFLVQTNVPAKVKIYYHGSTSDTGKFLFVPPSLSFSSLQKFSVVRLRAQTKYDFEIIAIDQTDHRSASYKGNFTTHPLPANLEEAAIGLVKGTKTSYPLTIFDHNHNLTSPPPEQFDPPFNGMVIVDSIGHIVWYYESKLQIPGRTSSGIGDIKKIDNNFYLQNGLASGGYDNRIFAITPLGLVLFQSPSVCTSIEPTNEASQPLTGGAHYEIQLLKDGKILYLGHEVRYIPGLPSPLQNGNSIREWNPVTNIDRQVWSPFDFINPLIHRTTTSNDSIISLGCDHSTNAMEWTHANTLSIGLSGNYLWNSRNLDT